MGRIISVVLVIVIIGYLLAFITTRRETSAITSSPSTQGVSVLDAVNALPRQFSESGTLAFYPNNVGPIPYLFYQDQAGRTVAKALSFPDFSPTDFSSWSGGHVFVTGRLEKEHVVVSDITYLSGP